VAKKKRRGFSLCGGEKNGPTPTDLRRIQTDRGEKRMTKIYHAIGEEREEGKAEGGCQCGDEMVGGKKTEEVGTATPW